MRLWAAALCLCSCALYAADGAGQVRPDSLREQVIRVGTIAVQATRAVTTAGGASALEVRLDSLVLAPAPTLEQVLRALPLVQVRTNSRGEAQFSLRGSGSDARQVAVLLDGIPLNLGWDARADLSVLPVTAATSLTLVRGLPSLLHGPNVLGGVVEVGVGHHPGHWMPPQSAEVSAGIESTGAYSATASFAQPIRLGRGDFAVRAGAGYRDRPGFALARGIGQPDAADDLRTNTDLVHRDGFIALRYLSDNDAWATLAASSFTAERGIPAELHTTAPRYWRYPYVSRTIAVVSGGTGHHRTPFGGRGDIEASIGVDVGRTDIVAYASGEYDDPIDTEQGDDVTLTLRLLADHTLGDRGDLGMAFMFADIRHDELLSRTVANAYRQRIWSLAAETGWSVGDIILPNVRVSVGAALDGADTPASGDKPPLGSLTDWGGRLGATSAVANGTVLLHAGVSRRARFPALRELYSGALGRFAPNPALRPERLIAAEAGATRRLGTGEVQLVGFYRSLRDAIERVALQDSRFQRLNRGEARSYGVELLATSHVGPFSIGGDLTFQRVRLFDGGAVTGRPEYQPNVLAGLNVRATLPYHLRAGMAARYIGTQYCADPDAAGELRLAGSSRLDVDATRAFRVTPSGPLSRLDVSAAIDNIADAAIYDQCGLPQPGRTLRLQIRMR
jgi:iron complex outermembrane recepter protein